MSTEKPPYVGEYNYVSYEGIVNSWGYDVLSWEVTGSYQGDHVVLLGDGDRRAWMMIGYGSCSGCDHLQMIAPYSYGDDENDWSKVIEFSESLKNSIEWKNSPEELVEELKSWLSDDGRNDWYYHDEDVQNAVRGFITQLTH